MPTQEQNHSLTPRSGSGQEVYVFDTVPVPPSNADSFTNQRGPEPSLVTPGTGNISENVEIGIIGNMLDSSATDASLFPLKIKIVNLSTQSIIDRDIYKGFRLDQTKAPVDILRDVISLTGEARLESFRSLLKVERYFGRQNTPRIIVQRAGDEPLLGNFHGLKTQFTRFPASSIYLPVQLDMDTAPYSGNFPSAGAYNMPASQPLLIHDKKNDKLCIFYLYRYDNTVNDVTPLYLHGLAYKQGEKKWEAGYDQSDAPDYFEDLGVSDKIFNGPIEAGVSLFEYDSKLKDDTEASLDYAPYHLSGVYFNENIYLIFTEPEKINFTTDVQEGSGSFFVTVFSPKEDLWDRFRPIAGPIKVGQTAGSKVLNISSAALRDKACVAMGTQNTTGVAANQHTIQITSSADMVRWGVSETGDDADTRALSSLTTVWNPDVDDEELSPRMTEPVFGLNDLSIGFFASKNKIFRSADSGKTWGLAFEAPELFNYFRFIKIKGEYQGQLYILAYSVKDVLFESKDSGLTWHILSASSLDFLKRNGQQDLFRPDPANEGEVIDPIQHPWGDGTSGLISDMDFKDINTGFWCGIDLAYYTVDGALSWNKIELPEDTGIVWTIQHMGYDNAEVLLMGGDKLTYVHDATSGAPTFTDIEVLSTSDTGQERFPFIIHVSKYSDSEAYICGNLGYAGKVTFANPLEATPNETLTQIKTNTTREKFTQIYRLDASGSGNTDDFLMGSESGVIWRAFDGDGDMPTPNWVKWNVVGSIVGIAPVSGTSSFSVTSLYRAFHGRLDLQNRRNPTLVAIEDTNEFLLSCINVDTQKVELWKSSDGGVNFEQLSRTFNARDIDLTGRSSHSPITQLADGSIVLQTFPNNNDGDGSYARDRTTQFFVSYDYGENWEDFNVLSPGYSYFSNTYNWDSGDTDQQAMHIRTLSSKSYGGNRVFSLGQNGSTGTPSASQDKYSLFSLYEWENQGSQMSIIPSVPQWIGIDDLRIVFSGVPSVEDEWDVDLRYRYDIRNIAQQSPSVHWRSTDDTQNVELLWNRTAFNTEMGPGRRFNVDSFSFFETNFENLDVEISGPDYDDDTEFPTDVSDVTKFTLNATIENGTVVRNGLLDGSFRDTSKSWVPHQFKPGVRDYYLKVINTPITQVFRILDNTENTLILEQDMSTLIDIGDDSPVDYRIFGNRLISLGDGGSRGSNPIVPGILNTRYSNPMWIKVSIPAQETAEGYFKIGSHLFGTQTPVAKSTGSGEVKRNRFSRGFTWQPITFSREEVGFTGVSSVEDFGRTIQRWQLNYNNIEWWDRDYTINGILSNPRKPFVFIFDNNKITESCNLVRLQSTPSVQHVSGDRYNYSLVLQEVP